ncbi:MAG: hypothetical protein KIS92_20620 [Planctomycetota bacterium]|nr:hypothetical protein [Planctomycetota bacterium]
MERKDRIQLVGAFSALVLLVLVCAVWGFLWDAESSAQAQATEPAPNTAAVPKASQAKSHAPPPLLAAAPKNLQLEQLADGSWMALFPARTLEDPARFQSLEYLVVPEKSEKAYEGLAVVPPTGWKALKGALNAGYPIVELRWKNELGQIVRHTLAEVFPRAAPTLQGNLGVLLNRSKNSNEAKNPNLPPDGTEILIAVHMKENLTDAAWGLWE